MNDINTDDGIVGEHFAVIFTPKRSRGRFPENCVEVLAKDDLMQRNTGTCESCFVSSQNVMQSGM